MFRISEVNLHEFWAKEKENFLSVCLSLARASRDEESQVHLRRMGTAARDLSGPGALQMCFVLTW